MGRRSISVSALARLLASDRSSVRGALARLEELGLAVVERDVIRNHPRTRIRTLWPDWLDAEVPPELRVRPLELEQDEEKLPESKTNLVEGKKNEELSGNCKAPDETPTEIATPGGSATIPLVGEPPSPGGSATTNKSSLREERVASRKTSESFSERPPGDEDPHAKDGEVGVGDEDEGSGNSGKRKANASHKSWAESGEEYLERPSERPEWNRWRKLPPERWIARDLLGYWICRYRKVRGKEDSTFFAPNVDAPMIKVHLRNLRLFVQTWLKNDFIRAKGEVDRIFSTVEAGSYRSEFCYFFTPSNGQTLANLGKKYSRGKPTPVERNDAEGADRAAWNERAERWAETRRKKRAESQ